ncbi:MAG: sigma-70 family RNA polymerase sigma factor [Schwartzia sp.]|nr:sigma-70 family RNA polymerase sigma factor [Schwartzia sp. (in: firmicutes)]
MKISLYYEDRNHPTILNIPDEECTVMVETDYQRRLAAAEDKDSVRRRTVQEIMDEDFNKPTFNKHQAETRRHVSLESLNLDDAFLAGSENVETDIFDEDYEELHRAFNLLKPKQRELLTRVFWHGMRQVEVAKAEGVSEAAIAQRMSVIYKRMKKILTAEKNFSQKP